VVLRDGDKKVTLYPSVVIDPTVDSPELEAELIKGIEGPHTPYTPGELRKRTEKLIQQYRNQ
jgi:hypothetical protein